jgi:hypothetical protein
VSRLFRTPRYNNSASVLLFRNNKRRILCFTGPSGGAERGRGIARSVFTRFKEIWSCNLAPCCHLGNDRRGDFFGSSSNPQQRVLLRRWDFCGSSSNPPQRVLSPTGRPASSASAAAAAASSAASAASAAFAASTRSARCCSTGPAQSLFTSQFGVRAGGVGWDCHVLLWRSVSDLQRTNRSMHVYVRHRERR